jgi:hypothetical protein
LATLINGNFIWIATKGFLPAAIVAGSSAIGDQQYGVSGDFTCQKVSSGGSMIDPHLALTLTAIATAGTSDILINCDPTF